LVPTHTLTRGRMLLEEHPRPASVGVDWSNNGGTWVLGPIPAMP